jgi:hypothetical protein
MTVPSDAGKAESLTRPTSSTSLGAGGMSSMGVPDPGPSRRRPSTKKGKGKKSKASKKRVSTTVEAGEYQTASGKVIRLDETTRVPMAESKKKQIRIATTAVFFAIVAAVVGVAVVAIVMITGGPGGDATDVAYDPAANPYTLSYANVMGLPVRGRTVVVIEASQDSAAWTAAVGDMIADGLSRESVGNEAALVGAGSAKPVLLAGGPTRKLPLNESELTRWFAGLPADGEADIAAAIKAALDAEPETLVVVVGDADAADIDAWDAVLKDAEDLRVHAVYIGNSSPELQAWMNERGGEAVVLSIDQIEYLKEVAEEEAE